MIIQEQMDAWIHSESIQVSWPYPQRPLFEKRFLIFSSGSHEAETLLFQFTSVNLKAFYYP